MSSADKISTLKLIRHPDEALYVRGVASGTWLSETSNVNLVERQL